MSDPTNPDAGPAGAGGHAEPTDGAEVRDALPADLDVTGLVGPYRLPDNSRRRVPAVLYLFIGILCIAGWALTRNDDPVAVNEGILWVGIGLLAASAYGFSAGWHLGFDEKEALVRAQHAAGFAIGHASAQLGWRGLRSRPTWRILLYSIENPPAQRAFVLVDGVDGSIVESLVEANPEDWTTIKR